MNRLIPLLLATLFFGVGCEALEYRPQAVGRDGEIVVVTDSASWEGELGDALREELSPYIGTLPAPEPLFELRRWPLSNNKALELARKQKNIFFAAPLADSTREALYMRSVLDPAATDSVIANGLVAVIGRRNEWAQSQQVYYLIGRNGTEMAEALRTNGEGIRYNFNKITRERLSANMFEKRRQVDIEERLLTSHGFAVNAQHDYLVAMDTTNFVWMRRIVSSDSWRSLFVWYTDELSPADLGPDWILDVRDRLTSAYIQGNLGGYVQVDRRRPIEPTNIDFLGRFAYEVRGLWHMVGPDENGREVQYGMGGPFVTYGFYDEETGRTYVVDGMVFAPGFSKREFLRQMEAIAHTFRTQEEVTAAAEAVASND